MASERFGPPFVFPQSPPPPRAPIHNMKKGYWSFSYQTQSWKFLTNNVNKLLITTHPIRNLWTQAAAEMNKRGFLRRVSLSFSPQSPLSFPPFPFPFNACMQATSTRDFIPYLVLVCGFFWTVISEVVAVWASDFRIFLQNVEKIHFFEEKIIYCFIIIHSK